ncbi:MAG: HTH-type transcriptional regulator betI [Ilumatobacteraceae bacterium]|nr:HTH-type transcriptional regulator betI [Ilumatobacteraceae bacterium]
MPTKSLESPSSAGEHTRSARDRLLDAADELFYEDGVLSVGIDRIIERAGVAKATLYSVFGSKDELIRAYLHRRHVAREERIDGKLALYDTPRERLLSVYEALADLFSARTFRGCAFVNASAEAHPGSTIAQMSDEYRGWMRSLFVDLCREASAPDPELLAKQLTLLYDGAIVAAKMDHDPEIAMVARSVAASLVDAAIPAR